MSKDLIDNFIIDTMLIDPIRDIITKLENNNFRDCDITWLNNKLDTFTNIALETMGKRINIPTLKYTVLNDYVQSTFLRYFNVLLDYFKKYK